MGNTKKVLTGAVLAAVVASAVVVNVGHGRSKPAVALTGGAGYDAEGAPRRVLKILAARKLTSHKAVDAWQSTATPAEVDALLLELALAPVVFDEDRAK